MSNDNLAAPIHILIVDDDKEDCMLAKQALAEVKMRNSVSIVHDGNDALAYLRREPPFENVTDELPGMILSDIKMPRMDGIEFLQAIKSDVRFKHIPVIMLTTSSSEIDIYQSYCTGCAGYVSKPVTFDGLVEALKSLKDYWVELVKLPTR